MLEQAQVPVQELEPGRAREPAQVREKDSAQAQVLVRAPGQERVPVKAQARALVPDSGRAMVSALDWGPDLA